MVRVGNRRLDCGFEQFELQTRNDTERFAVRIRRLVHANPGEPLILAVTGYQWWLVDVFTAILNADGTDGGDIRNFCRQVQRPGTMQFPERASKRDPYVPWKFIVEQINVPQVYHWSVGMSDPALAHGAAPSIADFRFRIGVWQMAQGAYRFDPDVSVAIIFTPPTEVADGVVLKHLFPYLFQDDELDYLRRDEEGVCWMFSQLYWLLTDWENVIHDLVTRLDQAEENSHNRKLPVKMRARMMHQDVDRIYELKQFTHFHLRAFGKLHRHQSHVPREEQADPLWNDMADTVEDLQQYEDTLDGLKERFNNLLDLEFNIQNASQSNNAQFLSIVATLFLPASFLASLFGMSTVTWPPIWFLYIAMPLLALSVFATAVFPSLIHNAQRALYPIERVRQAPDPRTFTLLGEEMPDDESRLVRSKRTRLTGLSDDIRVDAQSRSRSSRARGEKDH